MNFKGVMSITPYAPSWFKVRLHMGQFSVTVLAVVGSNLSGNQQPMRRLPAGENDAQMSQTAHVFGDT